MRKLFDVLTEAFRAHEGVLGEDDYVETVRAHSTLFEDPETIFLLLQASGYPIETDERGYRLRTYFTPYAAERFCILDIETNGSKPGTSQVIEIGAVMVENGEIVDRFETFVACSYLPEYITKVTGIEPEDLVGAPSRREALERLRRFMGDAVFVAHNASFDYAFLDASFERFGLGNIGNPKLCTIDLAKRTFESERYGLAYLRESLGIDAHTPVHHRAYADALSAYYVFRKSMGLLPDYVRTTDDLIAFSTSSRKSRKKLEIRN